MNYVEMLFVSIYYVTGLREYIVLCRDGYCKWQYSCMNYVEMDFISMHHITGPKPKFVIIICHTIMHGSYLPKDFIFLLLPLAVI